MVKFAQRSRPHFVSMWACYSLKLPYSNQGGLSSHHFDLLTFFLIVHFSVFCSSGKRWLLHHRNARTLDIALLLQLCPSLVQTDQLFVRGKQCYSLWLHMLLWILASTQHRTPNAAICKWFSTHKQNQINFNKVIQNHRQRRIKTLYFLCFEITRIP